VYLSLEELFMRLKISTLAAAIAASMTASLALSQTQDTTPPSSTTQQSAGSSSTGSSSSTAPGAATGATTDQSAGAMGAAQIDQRKVEQFADAYVQVQTIQQKANAELESATDPAQAEEVKTTAQSDMIAAVERSGLQVEEFNQIVASMAADPELRSRVSAEVQKRVGGDTSAPGAGT
jgi:hypothetical protein